MTESVLTDAVLVDRVIAGFDDAFDELYRRHVESAWRVAQAVTGNRHDASDAVSEAFAKVLQSVKAGRLAEATAFRAYLLTATRNAGLDILRRSGKLRTGAEDELDLVAATAPGPAEQLAGDEDALFVAEAFRNLPERWRSVLWLTEVEGVATKEAADALGMSPNGAAQLAVRARAGLRERYLQAHVRGEVAPDCRFTVDHLGAYVGGGIAPRDLAKVDQHLAGCEPCRVRRDELEELGTTLRRIVLPLPIGLAALSATKVHALLTSASHTPATGMAKVVALAKRPTPFMRRVTGAAAAGVLGLGLLSIPFVDDDPADVPELARRQPVGAEAPTFILPTAALADATSVPEPVATPVVATAPPPLELAFTPPATPAEASPAPATQEQPAGSSTPAEPAATTEPPAEGVEVGAGANLGDHTAGVAVVVGAEPAVGVSIDGESYGTAPVTTPEEQGITIVAGPAGTISLP